MSRTDRADLHPRASDGAAEAPTDEIERYRFLVRLDDALRPLLHPADITLAAATLLGQFLRVNRCAYAHVEDELDSFTLTGDYNNGVPSIVGRYAMSGFGHEFVRLSRLGIAYVVHDTATDPRVADVADAYLQANIGAVISVPVVKAGVFVAGMAVHQSTAREWQQAEVQLLSMVANRCWESIERNRIALELHDSERRYRTLIETISAIVWHTRPGGEMFRPDASWTAFTGQGFEQLKGFGWIDAVHPDDRAAVRAAWRDAATGNLVQELGYRLRRHDGAYRNVLSRAAAIRADDGSVLEWVGNCTDVSDSARAGEALRLSESRAIEAASEARESTRRLHAVLDAAPVGIVYADAIGRIVLANPANRLIWGDHPLSENVEAYVEWKGWWPDHSRRHGKRLGPADWPLARALNGEEVRGDLIAIEPFDCPGERRTLLISARTVRAEDGAISGGVVANMDVSEQVQTEAALRESEEKFRIMANAMPQIVWSTLADGSHDYFNEKWAELTGIPQQRALGDEWHALLHPEDAVHLNQVWRHSLATGEPYEVQYRLRHKSGQYRWMLARALPVRDDEGTVTRWMGTSTDIHDQKDAEEQLQTANRRKDEFLAMLAHELRNPLAPISTAAQMLKLAGTDAAKIRQSSDIITRQVRHMTELVDDLLDVSRVTRGLVELDSQLVDIKAVVSNALEQVTPLIEARSHRLEVDAGAAEMAVMGDRNRLVQVVANLLNNAAKYTPRDGRITLRVVEEGGEVVVAVSDDGIGIDDALLPHVFELFTQAARTPDRSQGGLGLGLALVRSIVAMHGGQVAAHSGGRGQGSTFTIRLPAVAPLAAQSEGQVATTGAQPSTGCRIMVVDDNTDAAVMLSMLLGAHGHEAVWEPNGERALASAAGFRADAYILDIGLPDMDGYELARRLRAMSAGTPVHFIALTGYGQAHDRVLSQAAGFDHHLVKPVDLQQLEAILAGLGQSRGVV